MIALNCNRGPSAAKKKRTQVSSLATDDEMKPAAGEALAISIPRTESGVIRHFQERIYGLFVPEVP